MGLNDAGRYEIDVRLAQKDAQFEQALVLAADVRLEAVADDDLVIAGQPVELRVIAANRGGAAVTAGATLAGLTSPAGDCAPAPVAASSARVCQFTATVPADARLTAAHFKYATDAARSCSIPTCRPGCRSARRRSSPTCALVVGGEALTVPVHVRVALRGQPLQRREARRAARGAEVRGLGHARDPDRAGGGPGAPARARPATSA